LMKANGQHAYVSLGRMIRGQDPYDQAKVDAATAQWIDTAQKLPALFPPDSNKGATADDDFFASAKLFENKADVDARLVKFGKDAAEFNTKVKTLDALKAEWPVFNKDNCQSCHDLYRVKKG
jgi:cytochrome c556